MSGYLSSAAGTARSRARLALALRTLAAVCIVCACAQAAAAMYIPAKAVLAQHLLQRAWDRTNEGEQQVLPWAWADAWPLARLRDEHGEADLIVLAGASGTSLAFAPGHVDGSALPGAPGNTIIAGHRDTHFRFLRNTQLGDEFTLELPGGNARTYRVVDIEIADTRTAALRLDVDSANLTLVTCYPFDGFDPNGDLRYVVQAQAVDELAAADTLTARKGI